MMNLRKLRTSAEVTLMHLTLTADEVSVEDAEAYANLLEGLELVIASIRKLQPEPENKKLSIVALALHRSVQREPKQRKVKPPKAP